MSDERQKIEAELLKKTRGIVDELEKQKLPLVARVYVWMIRRKLKKYR